ncbi:MAG: 50S ribosomal protein L29, partial [bacterium]
DLRLKSPKELMKMVAEKKKELAVFTSGVVLQKEKNVKKGKLARKEIARILTLLREKEISEVEGDSV